MIISKKYLFLFVNFITVVGSMLAFSDFPLASLALKIKYIFVLYCLVDIISRRKKPCSLNVAFAFLIYALYIFLFGYIFKNPIVAVWTDDHVKSLLLFMFMLVFGSLEVIYYQCLEEYSVTSGIGLMASLLIQIVTHRHDWILNPVFAVYSFLAHDVMRSQFGFMHSNFVGNACFIAGAIFWVVYHYYSRNPLIHSKSKIGIVIVEALIVYIMLCTSSRSAMISFFLFVAGTLVIESTKKIHISEASVKLLKIFIPAGLVLGILFLYVSGIWGYIWNNSNRALNVSMNVKWVEIIGNKWTGMGLVENSAFISSQGTGWISAFGVQTSSLDMNYLYLYCTTGIVGCVLIASILVILGMGLYRNRKRKYGMYYLLLYLISLFYAFWETVLFTYRFSSMLIPHIIFFYGANKENIE